MMILGKQQFPNSRAPFRLSFRHAQSESKVCLLPVVASESEMCVCVRVCFAGKVAMQCPFDTQVG